MRKLIHTMQLLAKQNQAVYPLYFQDTLSFPFVLHKNADLFFNVSQNVRFSPPESCMSQKHTVFRDYWTENVF